MSELLTDILVISNVAYVVITYFVLIANRASVFAMKTQIDASIRPYVNFDLILCGPLIEAHLWNSGATPAFDVEIKIEPSLPNIAPQFLVSRLTNGPISMLTPDKRLREFVGSLHEIEQANPMLWFTGTIHYSERTGGRVFTEDFKINLKGLGEMAYIGHPEISEQLNEITKSLDGIRCALEDRLKN